jgi:hypothetical protein
MALKREKEIEWNWAQPPPPFPKCPGANSAFCGPSGCGKTTVLTSMVQNPYKLCFRSIHVFSPSIFIDSAWNGVVKFAKTLDTDDFKSSFHDEWDEAALIEIIAKQRERIRELKLTKTKKNLPQLLIICDDLADSGIMHNNTGVLTSCYTRGRHLGLSTWLSTQKLLAIAPICRASFAAIMCWELRNRKELFDGILNELSNIHSIQILFELYKLATEDPHSFLYVNLRAHPVEFYIRFEERLLVD